MWLIPDEFKLHNVKIVKAFPETYNPMQHIQYGFIEFKRYKDFSQRCERMIKEELDDYNKFLSDDEHYTKLGPKFNFESSHSYNLSIGLPNTLRKSLFISLMSYFEYSMNELCEVYEYHNRLTVNFKNMNGQGIKRAKLYLVKIVGLEFDKLKYWHVILRMIRIRNNIVHSYSEVFPENEQLICDVNSCEHLKLYRLQSKSLLQVEEKFLEYVLEVFDFFYKELLLEVEKNSITSNKSILSR
jgi:hypothetical protein